MKTKCTKTKQLLSILLCLCMVLSMVPGVPLVAKAAGTEGMITIEMTDSYGDGWNGNAIEIYANGELLDTATITEEVGSGTWTSQIDLHATYTFKWVLGSYPRETSFDIYVGTENKLSASGLAYSTGDTLFTLERVCEEPTYENGVCTNCGGTCIHEMNDAGICGVCGYECPSHSFTNGLCATCGGICSHPAAIEGKCCLCQQTVNLTIDMTAKYSYGWRNCAEITIFADGTQIGVAKLENSNTGSWSVPFDSLVTYTFQWRSLYWPKECSFAIKVGDRTVYSADNDACENLQSGVFFTIDKVCSDHTVFGEDGHCLECGLPCRHRFGEGSECDVCGFVCGTDEDHVWNLGVCEVCSLVCGHAGWTASVCDTCGLICGSNVAHAFGEDLECDVCGFGCGTDGDHSWNKGVCTVCGTVCPHERYESGRCVVCSSYEPAVQNGVGDNGFALYEISNASQLLWFADYVNSGEILRTYEYNNLDVGYTYYTTNCVNAKLMADIDMTDLPWVPIGKLDIDNNGYTGVFDGDGHTVSGIDYAVTSEDTVFAGFFGEFSGTVKNLTVVGNFKAVTTGETRNAYASGIAAYCIWSQYVLGYNDSEIVFPVIENCTFMGTVSGEAIRMTLLGGIAGMLTDGTMTNCVSAATVTTNQCSYPYVGGLVGFAQDNTYTNCYYDTTLCSLEDSYQGAQEGVTGCPTAVFESGAVAYALGFGQTLGTDPYPSYGDDPVYLLTTGCRSYTNTQAEPTEKAHVGTPSCTEQAVCQDCGEGFGEPLGHSEYGTDGKCTRCGAYEQPKQNGTGANGFPLYEIENASQLLWFINYVNSGEVLRTHSYNSYESGAEIYVYYTTNCVNAKLMADIDMTGLPWVPIGKLDIEDNGYTGVFDGDGHTVSGIDYAVTSEDTVFAGFFGEFSGTVKNLTVVGNFKAVTTGEWATAYVGGIAAYGKMSQYKLDYYYDDVERVCPVIENCTFIGTVSGEASNMTEVGGIAGYFTSGTMTNCVSAATVTTNQCSYPYVGGLVGFAQDNTFTNCYYDTTLCSLNASCDGALEGVTGLATADFADGAVAYALDFGQTLGTDAYPTYGDDRVYLATAPCASYTNTEVETAEKAHIGEATCMNRAVCQGCGESYGELADHQEYDADGKCTFCGEYDKPKQNGTGANGYPLYEIENASQLLWFADYVNSGEVLKTHIYGSPSGNQYTYYTTNCVNAKLMADIDMTGLPWVPIGKRDINGNYYTGVFDGDGHTVSGIDYAVTSEDTVFAGFFGEFSGTVKNLTVVGNFKAVTTGEWATAYVGGIAAYCHWSHYFLGYENYETVSSVIENCTFIGTVSAEAIHMAEAGGIAGLFSRGTMTNCVSAATATTNQCSYPYVSGLVGRIFDSTFTNCYYDTTLCNLDSNSEGTPEGVTGLATADFADGAVAYALGFGQTLGTDAYPTYGDDQVYQILNCKEETAYSNTNANLDHTWGEAACLTPKTCSTCGITEAQPQGHSWADATCTAPKTCTACGATEGYPDYDNHTEEFTVKFTWGDPYDDQCYVEADLFCSACEQYVASNYAYVVLTQRVEPEDCMHLGSETYEVTLELEGVEYTDVHTFELYSDNHIGQFENGFCTACGGYEPAVWNEEESLYEISNAGQLYWYAKLLNEQNVEIYAKLTADILIPENAPNWEPINASYAYFNGNFHTISGLKCIGDDRTYVGMFGNEIWWYEISNLHITNSYFEGKKYVGAVAGCMSNGGYITNCAVTNTIVKGDGNKVGGLVGYLGSHVINCFSTATIVGKEGNVPVGYCTPGYGSIENCYFPGTEDEYEGTTAMTAQDFASGKVAYLLQSNISEEDIYDEDGNWIDSYIPEVWGQTIGQDAYPVLKGQKVYQVTNCQDEVAYSNTVNVSGHFEQTVSGYGATCDKPGLTDGVKCSVCGETIKAQETIPAPGHDWKDATCDTPKTCDSCGATQGEALGHSPEEGSLKDNGDAHTFTCTNCNNTIPEAHSYTDSICVCGVVHSDAVVVLIKNGVPVQGFTTLADAVNAVQSATAEDEAVLQLRQNIDLGNGYQQIYGGVFTFDLNGFEVSSSNSSWGVLVPEDGVNITITDSGEGGKITAAGYGIEAYNSTVTITGGTITGGYCGVSAEDCTVEISGGAISSVSGVYAINGTVTISGGTISGQHYAVCTDFGALTISGGNISGNDYGMFIVDSTVEISGGCITGKAADMNIITSTITLTVGENGEGATFPDGITVYGTTLNAILGESAAYWQDGKMILPAEDAWKITGGDVVIKAVCTHPGDKTYTNNGDDHSYTYTCCGLSVIEEHTFVNGLCICGAKENLVADDLKFSGASLTLEDNLTINFKVKQEQLDANGYSAPYAVIVMGDSEVVIRDYTIENGKYVFAFKNVAPYRMNDTVTATLYATKDGVEYSSASVDYGVHTYCYNMLNKYDTASYAKLQTLLVDILNYGAASQLYVNYNTDQLVNAELTEAQKAWGTASDRQLTSVLDQEYATVANPTVKWTGASLVLKETVAMRFNFQAESAEGLTVKIVESNGTENLISTFTETEDGYYVYFDGLHAVQMSEPVYVTVYDGETAVSNTVCYSIESYACSKQTDENTTLVNLLKAMMKYGDAAKNYRN